MNKRLVLCFDGTWNKPDASGDPLDENTNVVKLRDSVLQGPAADGNEQIVHYATGVGTTPATSVFGGATGFGVSDKILDGYKFLCANYAEGDQIYISGFSRGAFTACSLAGMVCDIGLKLGNVKDVEAAAIYMDYLDRGSWLHGVTDVFNRLFTHNEMVKPPIEFLGVWDVVGALGVSAAVGDLFSKKFTSDFSDELDKLHDTNLHPNIKHGYHAMAIHENRLDFKPTLWTSEPTDEQKVQQVWFTGAHSNVGGGYADHSLSNIPLRWMLEKAQGCGLELNANSLPTITAANVVPDATDSYAQFMGGKYALIPGNSRHFRPMGDLTNGTEFVHPSVADWLAAKADRSITNQLVDGGPPTLP